MSKKRAAFVTTFGALLALTGCESEAPPPVISNPPPEPEAPDKSAPEASGEENTAAPEQKEGTPEATDNTAQPTKDVQQQPASGTKEPAGVGPLPKDRYKSANPPRPPVPPKKDGQKKD